MTRRSPDEYNWAKCQFDETIMTKHYTPQASKDVRVIVIHHMTIVSQDDDTDDALDACWRVWQSRRASAQYGIDGPFVRQFVWDKDYAWAAGSYANEYGISIEHANETAGPHWRIGDTTLDTSHRLVASLHVLYDLGRPSDATVKPHQEYMATACPGPYLMDQWDDYVARCAIAYDVATGSNAGSSGGVPTPDPEPKPKRKRPSGSSKYYDPTGDYSVKKIQRIVGVKADGYYGDDTKRAVRKMQRSLGVKADGLWGPNTEAAYESSQGPSLVVDGIMGPRTVKALQKWVGVKADGIMGPNTKRALQRELGVTVDGIIGKGTVSALQRKVGASVDGIWGSGTTRHLQRFLNRVL